MNQSHHASLFMIYIDIYLFICSFIYLFIIIIIFLYRFFVVLDGYSGGGNCPDDEIPRLIVNGIDNITYLQEIFVGM